MVWNLQFTRAWKHETVTAIAKNADVPVFNGLSDYNHSTQALCDLFTILEHTDPTLYLNNDFSKLKIVFIGDRTNVCSSLMHITTKMGMNFVYIAPKKYQSPPEWIDIAKANIRLLALLVKKLQIFVKKILIEKYNFN
ncbi:hypothetical protein [Spiroplasma poulsonii]|uniref:Putrescine carbamoyltransferase n=1 Tax=Spiroplasma poulsonii TaxID=2138 RepID=A0A2P6FFL2_9MOLU|nr:hypothetical protein [Spiroplasma poulsonii]KAF0850068.1 Putrescine carbamoyltransferase [Spiroplasma poulsonii]PQM32245.1 Putrescine carbamoyltransferase [Spiroplasma poulsonii]PWF94896.1 Putrescine carbamoyltransferase [Spiroplasma poulsonii]PWF97692.1 Putrescine carbamoyltransferase [Spiroplasma poulsonii]